MTKHSPFVYWGQDVKSISFRVDVKDSEIPTIELTKKSIRFQVSGIGSDGKRNYSFNFDFFEDVNPKFTLNKNDKSISFTIQKKKPYFWTRVTKEKSRYHWLKVDFDNFHTGDTDDEQLEEEYDKFDIEEVLTDSDPIIDDILEDEPPSYPKVLSNASKEAELEKVFKSLGPTKKHIELLRRIYLCLYNFIQFFGNMIILATFFNNYSKYGPDAFVGIYRKLNELFKFLCLLRLLGLCNSICGFYITDNKIFAYQVFYRLFVAFVLMEFDPYISERPVVFFLILLYSIYDASCAIYYSTRVMKLNFPMITWLRCTLWVPILPLSFLFESILLLRSIPFFEKSQKLSLIMPNPLNVTFYMSTFIKLFLFFVFLPIMYFSMNRMYAYRLKTLHPNRD